MPFESGTYYETPQLYHIPKAEKRQCLPGFEKKGQMRSQSTEDFYSSKPISYNAVLVDICHYRYFPMHSTNRE